MKWEIIQRPKKFGGLGVGDLVIKNTALLFKWWLKFSNKPAPLWKKGVCSNYDLDMNRALIDQQLPGKGGSWNHICNIKEGPPGWDEVILGSIIKKIGRGNSTLFWHDTWLEGGSLSARFPRLFSISLQKDWLIIDMGCWDRLEWCWVFYGGEKFSPGNRNNYKI